MLCIKHLAQSQATQLNTNILLGFHFNPETALYVGGGTRLGDAWLAMLRMQIGGASIGLAYDITNSQLSTATRGQGAWELSFVFSGSGARQPTKQTKPIVPPVRYY